MAADIKSVNTKLICNGEDLSKKLHNAQGEVETFARAASKEITVPFARTNDSIQNPASGSRAAQLVGGLGNSAIDLSRSFTGINSSLPQPKKWDALDSAVSSVSSGLQNLGAKGVALAGALEVGVFAAKKLTQWLEGDEAKFGRGLVAADKGAQAAHAFNQQEAFIGKFRSLEDVEKGARRRLETQGMDPFEAQLMGFKLDFAKMGEKVTPAMQKVFDRASEWNATANKLDKVKGFKEGLDGPEVKARRDLTEMQQWRDRGLINPAEFGEGALNTINGLERKLGLGMTGGRTLAGAASAESVEGVQAVLTAQNVDGKQTMEERLIAINEETKRVNEQIRDQGEELNRLFQQRPDLIPGNFNN